MHTTNLFDKRVDFIGIKKPENLNFQAFLLKRNVLYNTTVVMSSLIT
jgi:hypothetical protein